ncbi:MAG: succinate dehydrogenase cytochrome b subunit [Caldilineaceae bacterium]
MAAPVNILKAPVNLTTVFRTTIGMKVLMAVTGLIWIGFLFFHMYGNVKVFLGPEYFNAYAEGLRELGHPVFGRLHLLTLLRVIMVVAFVTHVYLQFVLYRKNAASRSTSYSMHKKVQANPASLTMRYGGVAILFFVLYHLSDLTWGVPGIHSDFQSGQAYHNLTTSFQSPINVVLYLIALAALAMHLYHGTWSMFQTLGVNSKRTTPTLRLVALGLAVVIPVGFAIVPLSVFFGIVPLL